MEKTDKTERDVTGHPEDAILEEDAASGWKDA